MSSLIMGPVISGGVISGGVSTAGTINKTSTTPEPEPVSVTLSDKSGSLLLVNIVGGLYRHTRPFRSVETARLFIQLQLGAILPVYGDPTHIGELHTVTAGTITYTGTDGHFRRETWPDGKVWRNPILVSHSVLGATILEKTIRFDGSTKCENDDATLVHDSSPMFSVEASSSTADPSIGGARVGPCGSSSSGARRADAGGIPADATQLDAEAVRLIVKALLNALEAKTACQGLAYRLDGKQLWMVNPS